jgi:hypothetical protein
MVLFSLKSGKWGNILYWTETMQYISLYPVSWQVEGEQGPKTIKISNFLAHDPLASQINKWRTKNSTNDTPRN